jgi:hypothetical protein
MTTGGVSFGVSYFGVRDLRHVRSDLDEIAEAGFSFVVHTFSEHDLRFHVGDLARIVEESRLRGLRVELDPWGVGGIFGGEAYSELALVELGSRQTDARGRSVPACCPNARETRELMSRWVEVATSLAPHGIFWDEPHFYLGGFRRGERAACCRCQACREAFSVSSRPGELPPEGDTTLQTFRADSLARFLREAIRHAGADVEHSLCLLPRGEFHAAGSDSWDAFESIREISRFATDPYWMDRPVDPSAYVRRHAAELASFCRRTSREMEVWIQGIRIPAGKESSILEAVKAAVEEGAARVAFWSFRGTERMHHLACGDPARAWEVMKESVRRFG